MKVEGVFLHFYLQNQTNFEKMKRFHSPVGRKETGLSLVVMVKSTKKHIRGGKTTLLNR